MSPLRSSHPQRVDPSLLAANPSLLAAALAMPPVAVGGAVAAAAAPAMAAMVAGLAATVGVEKIVVAAVAAVPSLSSQPLVAALHSTEPIALDALLRARAVEAAHCVTLHTVAGQKRAVEDVYKELIPAAQSQGRVHAQQQRQWSSTH